MIPGGMHAFLTYEHLKAKQPARTAVSCYDQQLRKNCQ
uniref:Uncharacterized protein n=1 Tax=Arundo donax TaxID=35708 RepID=A0A0A9DVX9_ARUDO